MQRTDASRKRSSMGWITWGFFMVFSVMIVVMILNALAPRQPGQPATGGFQTMPSNTVPAEPGQAQEPTSPPR